MIIKRVAILITVIISVGLGIIGFFLVAPITAQETQLANEVTASESEVSPPEPTAITYTADAASQALFSGDIPAGQRVVSQIIQPGEWGLTTFAPLDTDVEIDQSSINSITPNPPRTDIETLMPLPPANDTPPIILIDASAQAGFIAANEADSQPLVVNAPQADNIVTLIKTVGTKAGICAAQSSITISSSGNTTLYFCFRIINDGGQTLETITLIDDLFGKIYSEEAITLVPGAEHQLILDTPVNSNRVDAATVTAVSTDSETAVDSDTTTVTTAPPALNITMEVKEGVYPDCNPANATSITKQANSFVTFCYLLENTGPTDLDTLTLSDNVIGSIYNNYAFTLGTGNTALITRTAYVTQTVSNVATVSMEEVGFNTVVNDTSNNVTVNVPLPAGIAITKTVKAGAGGACNIQFTSITVPPNSYVTYCYRYTNTGITDLRPLTVIDQDPTLLFWDGSNQDGILFLNFPSTLAAGSTQSFTRTRYITQTVSTNATISMPERGSNILVEATSNNALVNVPLPAGIAFTKTVKAGAGGACNIQFTTISVPPNSFVTYCYRYTNLGIGDLRPLTVIDQDPTLLFWDGSNQGGILYQNFPTTLAAGYTQSFTRTRYITQTTFTNATIWMPERGSGIEVQSASNYAVVHVPLPTGIVLTKTAKANTGYCNIQSSAISVAPYTKVTYCYRYTNLGVGDLRPLTVVDQDPLLPFWDGSYQGGVLFQNFPSTLPAGMTQSFTRTRIISDSITSFATITMTERGSGIDVTYTAAASVDVVENPDMCTSLDFNFNSGIDPSITIFNYQSGNPVVWSTIAGSGEFGNYTGGGGNAASASSRQQNSGNFDTALQLPAYQIPLGASQVDLTFRANYQNLGGINADNLDLEISLDTGRTWQTVLNWGEDHGSFASTPGEFVTVDLLPYRGSRSATLRWHYHDSSSPSEKYYAQLDDIAVTCTIALVAADDAGAGFSTDEDNAFTTANVLANDIDPNGFPLSVQSVDSSGTQGTVTDNGDGTLTYDPNGQFEALAVGEQASDSFSYIVSNGNGDIDNATVTIVINGANDAPTAVSNSGSGFSTSESSAFTTLNVLSNDTDPDGSDTLSVISINSSGTQGLVNNNGDGTFGYTPNGQFESLAVGEQASDSFTYTISDGNGGSDSGTVTITINGANDAPTAVSNSGSGFSTNKDHTFTTANVLGNDTDPDSSDTLSVLSINSSSTLGTVTSNGNGTFNYDPNGQFDALGEGDQATDTFIYTVSDGNGGMDTAVVTIVITGGQGTFYIYLPTIIK